MRVALIYPKIDYNLDFVGNDGYAKNMSGYPPLSLAYVASIIRRSGHEAAIIDGNIHKLNLNAIVREIKRISPDLLGFTVTFPTFHAVRLWIKSIKEIINMPVILGGASLELYLGEFMRHKEVDYIICGPALSSLPRFLDGFSNRNKKDFYNIPGLCFREKEDIIINRIPSAPDDINDMPFPARDLLPNAKYFSPFSERKNFTPFIASKGCLFRCVYCCLSNELQLRPVEDIMEELQECYLRFMVRDIDFFDSIFTIDKNRALEICRGIRAKKLEFRWSARTHISFIDEELLKEMAASGCRMIMYGIESTDKTILNNLKRRDISLGKIKDIVSLTRKNNIYAFGFFMLGCPGETEVTMRDTIKASRELGLDFAQFTRIIPVPGTELYKDYLSSSQYDYWRQVIIDNKPRQRLLCIKTGVDSDLIVRYVKKGNVGFYLRWKQIIRIILSIRSRIQLINYIRSGYNVLISYFFWLFKKRMFKDIIKIKTIILFILFSLSLFKAVYTYGKSEIQLYLDQGKYNEAINCLKEEIRKNPNEPDSYCKLGEVYRKQRNYDEAIKWFKEAIRINPKSSSGYIELGRTYENMDNYDEAIKWHKEAIRINPKDDTACEGLGEVYFEMSNFDEAMKWHKEALRINPRNFYAYYGLGDIYRKQQIYNEAIKCYKEAIRINPDNSQGYDSIGFVYYNMSNYGQAIKWYKEALSRDPKNTNVHYGLGLVYEAIGNYGEAAKLYKEAIRINPDDFGGYEGVGRIYAKEGKYEEAVQWYKESVKRGSSNHILCPYEGLGLLYKKLGKPQKTEETFAAMIKIKPYNSLGYYNLARYYYEIGKFELGRQNIDKALSLAVNPTDKLRGLQLKGLILIMQQDYYSAEGLFNGLIKEYGTNCSTLAGLGYIANARKDYRSARKYFEDALKQPNVGSPDRSPVEGKVITLLGLGWVNANEHKYKEAIACYEQILKEQPLHILALVGMGNAYNGLGEYAKAEWYLKKAIQINPDFSGQRSRELLKKIETHGSIR